MVHASARVQEAQQPTAAEEVAEQDGQVAGLCQALPPSGERPGHDRDQGLGLGQGLARRC